MLLVHTMSSASAPREFLAFPGYVLLKPVRQPPHHGLPRASTEDRAPIRVRCLECNAEFVQRSDDPRSFPTTLRNHQKGHDNAKRQAQVRVMELGLGGCTPEVAVGEDGMGELRVQFRASSCAPPTHTPSSTSPLTLHPAVYATPSDEASAWLTAGPKHVSQLAPLELALLSRNWGVSTTDHLTELAKDANAVVEGTALTLRRLYPALGDVRLAREGRTLVRVLKAAADAKGMFSVIDLDEEHPDMFLMPYVPV